MGWENQEFGIANESYPVGAGLGTKFADTTKISQQNPPSLAKFADTAKIPQQNPPSIDTLLPELRKAVRSVLQAATTPHEFPAR